MIARAGVVVVLGSPAAGGWERVFWRTAVAGDRYLRQPAQGQVEDMQEEDDQEEREMHEKQEELLLSEVKTW